MNLKTTSRKITLDWDNIKLDEAVHRYNEIIDSPNCQGAILSRSPTKGFHCRVWFFHPVRIARCRFNLNDDPRRLLHDLFNRSDNVHDILWDRKSIGGIIYKAQQILEIKK